MKHKKVDFVTKIGLLLMAAALFLLLWNLLDNNRAARASDRVISTLETEPGDAVGVPDYVLDPNMPMPEQVIDGTAYIGVLEIPSLGLSLPVISAWSYPNLRIAPCRYTGSAYTDDLVLAAHNYASHFGQIKYLKAGDTVTFTDVAGNVFTYRVAVLETLMPTAVEEMTSGGWDLTLFTCTIGGQSRVTVRCERKES